MRISDWSSDVCSSDLIEMVEKGGGVHAAQRAVQLERRQRERRGEALREHDLKDVAGDDIILRGGHHLGIAAGGKLRREIERRDRKSVVSGKSVSVRVDLGGRRIHKKKKKT